MPSGLLKDYLGTGPVSNRPAMPDLSPGTLGFWFDPITDILYCYDGQFWTEVGGGGIPDAPDDGSLYARRNLAWESFIPGGGGGGGGGSAPTIVQAGYTRNDGGQISLVLPAAPTPGNILLLIQGGFGNGDGGAPIPLGFEGVGYFNNINPPRDIGPGFQGGFAAIRHVLPNDPTNYNDIAGGQLRHNWALIELTPCNTFFFGVGSPRHQNGNYRFTRQKPVENALYFMMQWNDSDNVAPQISLEGYQQMHFFNTGTLDKRARLYTVSSQAVGGGIAAPGSDPYPAMIWASASLTA